MEKAGEIFFENWYDSIMIIISVARSLKKTKPCQLKKSSFPSVIHNKSTDLLFSDNAYTCKVAWKCFIKLNRGSVKRSKCKKPKQTGPHFKEKKKSKKLKLNIMLFVLDISYLAFQTFQK